MGALTLSVVQTDYDIILTCRGLAQYNVLRFHMKYVLFSHIYTRMQKKNFKIKIVIIWVGFFFLNLQNYNWKNKTQSFLITSNHFIFIIKMYTQ